jgi:hypothetical protein
LASRSLNKTGLLNQKRSDIFASLQSSGLARKTDGDAMANFILYRRFGLRVLYRWGDDGPVTVVTVWWPNFFATVRRPCPR